MTGIDHAGRAHANALRVEARQVANPHWVGRIRAQQRDPEIHSRAELTRGFWSDGDSTCRVECVDEAGHFDREREDQCRVFSRRRLRPWWIACVVAGGGVLFKKEDRGDAERGAAASCSPRAWMTLARRSRSAWRAMARRIVSGSSTSLTSTRATLTPHGLASSSMICWSRRLMTSRLASSSSCSTCPRTERSVICATSEVA